MNDLMNLLKERRTYRRFCQKPISEEILAEILTAARYASLSLIHISEPTRLGMISYAVFCLKKKKEKKKKKNK